jgi:hypothetical protein
MLDVWWIALAARSVHAVWPDHITLISHFEIDSNYTNRDSKEKATYMELKMIQILFVY